VLLEIPFITGEPGPAQDFRGKRALGGVRIARPVGVDAGDAETRLERTHEALVVDRLALRESPIDIEDSDHRLILAPPSLHSDVEVYMEKFPEDPTAMTVIEYDTIDRDTVESFLRDLGVDSRTANRAGRNVKRAREVMSRVTEYAKHNPAVVLGALSALVAGGAVAAGAAVKKSSAKKKSASKKASSKKATPRKRSASAAKRTLIEPHAGDKRYIRRDAKGRIKESVDVGRSLSADRRSKSKTKSKAGQGDKGDR